MTDIAALLRAAGLSEREADAKERLSVLCTDALGAAAASAERAGFFVPGRIEILGKHTDYAGGRSLLCAVERGFIVIATPRADSVVRVTDAASGETRALALDTDLAIPRDDWSSYVAACVRRLARNFPDATRGADIAFASDLPQASGMSSSSALSTAIFLVLDAINHIADEPAYREAIDSREALAGYLGTIENGQSFGALAGDLGVGTFGGSEDHTAILCCRSGLLSRYSFTPVRVEGEIACPPALKFVVAFSGVAAEKGFGAQQRYNELSLGVQRIVALWNAATGRRDALLAAAVSSAPDAAERIRVVLEGARAEDFTPQRLLERFDQFVAESTVIIPKACDAFARGDLTLFGELVGRSQHGAESLLRNQIPETIGLVRVARGLGAHAASAFGGGFGGSVWALVDSSGAEDFAQHWRVAYERLFQDAAARAEFIVTRAGPGQCECESWPSAHIVWMLRSRIGRLLGRGFDRMLRIERTSAD